MRAILVIVVLALSSISSAADANPRLVVLPFEGPAPHASLAQGTLVTMLANKYDFVATETWQAARASAKGPNSFRRAAKRARVDAIIEGWLDDDRTPTLTIAVRDAMTGRQIEEVSAALPEKLLTVQIARRLEAKLDEVLGTINGELTADPEPALDEMPPASPLVRRTAARTSDVADDDDENPLGTNPRRVPMEPAAFEDRQARNKRVLGCIFCPPPPQSVEESILVGKPSTAPTPRIRISAGGFVQSRGMAWSTHPDSDGTPPEYPAAPVKGIAAHIAVFPLPKREVGGVMSGPGFTLEVAHAMSSMLTAIDENDVVGDYTLSHTSWEAGAHWRWPIDLVSVDAGLAYGASSYALEDGFPESVPIPNTSYQYVTGGVAAELAVTQRATVGAGAHYLYILGAGQLTEEPWYGAGTASGLAFDGRFSIPLPSKMFIDGTIEYRRFKVDLDGSGVLTYERGLSDVVDTAITASVRLGVQL